MTNNKLMALNNSSSITIRFATTNDLTAINDIYNFYVLNSTCTYQIKPETIDDRYTWFSKHNDNYPVLVAETNNGIWGWASISKYKEREAYIPTVESSIYIHYEKLFQGIGTILLNEIIYLARKIGHHSIIAGISADQTASIILHEKYNFKKVAHLKQVGYKFNTWLDVFYFQLLL